MSVQNLFNLAEGGCEAALEHCEREGIAFIPWFPLATGQHPRGSRRPPRGHPGPAGARLAPQLSALG
ncbi:hypothetical protein [Streptomyces sp. NPDC051001]|uniref:hypothetical protein n=1 Tax=Streptomyces sp. NPDC051001 TaxID=3155795 RepID=UPI00343A5479